MSYFLFDKSLLPLGCAAVLYWGRFAPQQEQAPSPQGYALSKKSLAITASDMRH